ncbi:efflux RND transporter periplasmic adaptor subunit [Spirosoma endophyticum]|uniref:Membrane fusion protein, cobalt-zinc-cadmium efflux system n=1 Tax=Spirosoma endophyticum TaxID=662367 RepID=A0A1I2DSW4_9BACT|nr:efflux RND transporter periplasmic adaptor subunit [Spirosoma endophyticum]SFE83722.1 membrane fusion protein, cobalt-zinc-cadmium efflux system [Spirosoma endophyticum]
MKRILCSIGLLWLTVACREASDKETTTATDVKPTAEAAEGQPHHDEGPADVVELSNDQLRIGAIGLGSVEYRNLGQLLQLNGRLAVPAQSQVAITALQGGFVRSLPLLPGQPVRKGQVLARIENPDLVAIQQEYAENQSRLTYLDAEYARQKELSEQNVSALKVFQQTSSERNLIRSRLGGLAYRLRLVGLSAQAALDGKFSSYYVITAPLNGVVTNVAVTVGQYVQPADMMAQLTSSQGLYAELTVFEKDLPQIREGQRVSLRLNNESGKERSGRITYINRAIDADRSVRVVARLDQPDVRLAPNTFLKASLDLGDSRVTALPEEAIVSAEGKDYIFVVTDEKAPEEHEHKEGEAGHSEKEEHNHEAGEGEQHGTTFKQIPVRRGVTEGGYSQVTLPASLDLKKAQVVVKGAYAVLSQLQAAGGEEEGHAH